MSARITTRVTALNLASNRGPLYQTAHLKTTPACRHAAHCVACANFPDGTQILRELLAIVGNDGYAITALILGGYRKDRATTIANYLDLYTPRHERLDHATAPRQ